MRNVFASAELRGELISAIWKKALLLIVDVRKFRILLREILHIEIQKIDYIGYIII